MTSGGDRRGGAGGQGGGGLQTWRGERVFTPSVSSGYGHSSGQAGTGIQSIKSIGAERVLLPLVIFTHERLSNNGLQPHVGAGMLLHGLASAGHEAWERDTHTYTHTRARGTTEGEGERSGEGEREEREYSEHISAKQHVSSCPCAPGFPAGDGWTSGGEGSRCLGPWKLLGIPWGRRC